MIQIKCEMCGSNNIMKENGIYICQYCGTKYSPDEAKKLMVEVIESANIRTPIQVKAMDQNYALLENAINTFNQGGYAEAYTLFSNFLCLEPNNPKAIFYRGLSAAYQSTVASPRYAECANATVLAVNKALQIFDNETLESFTVDVLHRFAQITFALCALYDGYVYNINSSVRVYGLTGVLVKNNTMNRINIQNNQTTNLLCKN